MRRTGSLSFVVLALWCASSTTAQRAVPRGGRPTTSPTAPITAESRAEELIRGGIELRQSGQDNAALALFTQAWELAPTPRARAQMGLAEFALSRWLIAEAHLREALGATTDVWVTQRRATLEQAYDNVMAHLAIIEIRGPHGTLVAIAGQQILLPSLAQIRLDPGVLSLSVQAEGYHNYEGSLNIQPGETRLIDVSSLLVADAVTPPLAVDPPPQHSVTQEPWFWIAVIGGALLVGGAVVVATTVPFGVEPAPMPASGLTIMTMP